MQADPAVLTHHASMRAAHDCFQQPLPKKLQQLLPPSKLLGTPTHHVAHLQVA
jgi:hypothetical protein